MAATSRPDVLDATRQFKAPHFSGRREDFENWIFRFESYSGLLGWDKAVIALSTRKDEIEEDLLDEENNVVSRALYHLLVTVVSGPALSLVKLTQRGWGFEALRRLYREYRTGLHEDHATMLAAILTPTWWGERTTQLFTDVLTQWDELIANYQMASGERVTDGMKTATMLAHAPAGIKSFLQACPRDLRQNHVEMRKAIWEHVLGGRAAGAVVIPQRYGQESTPMKSMH